MKRRIAITVALLALAGAPTLPSSGSIAYHQTDSNGAFQIWSVSAAGSSATQLTSGDQIPNPELCFEGCFSEHPDWAFDGSRIFFDSDRAGTVHVFSMAPDGSDVQQVTHSNGGFEGLPGNSPDGKFVAYDGQPEDPAVKGGIFMARVDGSGIAQRLTTGPKGGYDTAPQFSPDGSTVAFVRFRPVECPSTPRGCGGRGETGFKSAIYLVGTDGEGLRHLTDPGRVWGNPQWSPDGTSLLINSYYDPRGLSRGTSSDLWTVEPDGSDLTPITRTAGGSSRSAPIGPRRVPDRVCPLPVSRRPSRHPGHGRRRQRSCDRDRVRAVPVLRRGELGRLATRARPAECRSAGAAGSRGALGWEPAGEAPSQDGATRPTGAPGSRAAKPLTPATAGLRGRRAAPPRHDRR